MGVLNYFDLQDYGADVLIETGTGMGYGVDYALSCGLPEIHSCELFDEVYQKVCKKYDNIETVSIYNISSIQFLESLLPQIAKDKRIIFWLDAHFPGADYVTHEYKSDSNDINLPLIKEIEIIKKYRENCEDIILIDDMRILVPYAREELEKHGLYLEYPGLNFLDVFKKTHNINKYYDDQGYIEIIPKKGL